VIGFDQRVANVEYLVADNGARLIGVVMTYLHADSSIYWGEFFGGI
jgi:hypothetical protein